MKVFVEDVAMEVLKTLISSDQRELLEYAEAKNIQTKKALAVTALDIAEAFVDEFTERYSE